MASKMARMTVRLVHFAATVGMLIVSFVIMFPLYGAIFQLGVSQPTQTQMFELSQHGRSVYVTYQQYMTVAISQAGLLYGWVGWVAVGFAIQYKLGVPVLIWTKPSSSDRPKGV